MAEQRDESGLRGMLADLAPKPRARRSVPTDLRKRIREDYDAIYAARRREVTWQQITGALVAAGVRASDGSEPGWRTVMAAYHAERYARGEKRQRRKRTGTVPEVAPRAATAQPVPADRPVSEAPSFASEATFKPLRRSAVQTAPASPAPPSQPAPQTDADETIARLMGRRSADRPLMPPIPKPQRDED